LAKELNIIGLMNVQYAVKDAKVYVLEVNPRASRTIPLVSKVIGVPLANLATKVMLGQKLKNLGFTEEIIPPYVAVKESVFPFNRFPGVDVMLGPEMKSTGEVMGIDSDFASAYIKSQIAAGQKVPKSGNVFISVHDRDKRDIVSIAKKLNGKIQMVINTPSGRIPRQDEVKIRSQVILYNIPYTTTIFGAQATVNGIEVLIKKDLGVKSLQEYHKMKFKKVK
jgi:carbamoyl-phosphate synthase large subunit